MASRGWLERSAVALAACVAFLPFVRGALAGHSLYFRDLSLYFFPLRRFALEGLGRGEVRFWNPYVHEGVPLSLPAIGYPLDLLQLLRPSEPFFSLLLALHVPLAAIAFFALVRGLGLRREAAVGGAIAYALGGFLLSCVNLYVYLEAAAWAPLVVLGLLRVLDGGTARAIAGTALVTAVALSTTGVEVVAQALGVGLLLGWRRRGAATGRSPARAAADLGLTLALALLLAAPVLAIVSGQLAGSARGAGLPTDVVLSQSVHPFTLVQTLVAGLYGELSNLAGEWWGQNFFPRGFPYVLSLYLGATVYALAGVGTLSGRAPSVRLTALVAVAVIVCLGRWAGLAPLVDALPPLRAFRFPVKAFYGVHLGVSLLAAVGLDGLARGARRDWRTLALAATALGALLAALPLAPTLAPTRSAAFAAAFFPADMAVEARVALLGRVLADARAGGLVALAVAALALLCRRGLLAAPRAVACVVALATADLLRAGAGLNPMVSASFFEPSPALAADLPRLRQGRLFTCSVEESALYHATRAARGVNHEAWSFALLLETLSPGFNVPFAVRTAQSPDLTMLVPSDRVLSPQESSCRDVGAILPRLREAGVTTVLALEPLAHPDLEPSGRRAPVRIAPLQVLEYRLRGSLPRFALEGGGTLRVARESPGRLDLELDSAGPGQLLVREGFAPGWAAEVDGRAAQVRASGTHCAIALAPGARRVTLRYRPRHLRPALAAGLLGLASVLWLLRRGAGVGRAQPPPE